jgi:DNA-binding GntR family transcriptional regulator
LLAINREFHSVINQAAQNPEAASVLDRHRRLIAALWSVYGYGEDRPAGVISDHRHIIGALAARDADVVASLAMAHAAKAKQALIARMQAEDVVASSAAA